MSTSEERIARLIRLIYEVKFKPRQSRKMLLESMGISLTRFQEDREILAKLGFRFEWNSRNPRDPHITVVEDCLAKELGLTITESIITILALQQIRDSGDPLLCDCATAAATKLSGIMPEYIRTNLLRLASHSVVAPGHGCKEDVVKTLEQAFEKRRLVQIHYKSMNSGGTLSWRTVEPIRLHMTGFDLYLYGKEIPVSGTARTRSKTYLVSRIESIKITNMLCEDSSNDGFAHNHENAFRYFMGESTERVTILFRGLAAEYVRERQWHHSQQLRKTTKGLLFSVEVAEAREVFRWSMTFWPHSEIISPKWLRQEALETAKSMAEILI